MHMNSIAVGVIAFVTFLLLVVVLAHGIGASLSQAVVQAMPVVLALSLAVALTTMVARREAT